MPIELLEPFGELLDVSIELLEPSGELLESTFPFELDDGLDSVDELDGSPVELLLGASPLEELLDRSEEDKLAELLELSLRELEELRTLSLEELLCSSNEDEMSEPGSSSSGFTEEVSSPQAAKSATVPIRAKRFKTGKKSLSAKIFILPPFKISTAV